MNKSRFSTYQVDVGGEIFNVNYYTNGYYINLPKVITFRKVKHAYDAVSYIAEFGGWAGLFIGLSLASGILTLFKTIDKFPSLTFFSAANIKRIRNLINCACTLYLVYLVFSLTSKLLDYPTSTSITVEDTKLDFDLTFCTTKKIRVMNKTANEEVSFDSLYTEEFYNYWNNITSKISNMEFISSEKSWYPLSQYPDLITSINLPLTNGTLDFCHTIHLAGFTELKKIEINAIAEIKLFIHYPGQLIYSWRHWKNTITTLGQKYFQPIKYSANIYAYGLTIILSIDKITQVDVDDASYDQCSLNQLFESNTLSQGFKSMIKSQYVVNFSDEVNLKQHNNAVRLIKDTNLCKPPMQRINANFFAQKEKQCKKGQKTEKNNLYSVLSFIHLCQGSVTKENFK